MDSRFIIISCCHNSEKWISKNIESCRNQKYRNYLYYLYVDAATDKTLKTAKESAGNDSRFNILSGAGRKYAALSRWHLLKNAEVHDNDIVVFLDGDDWFYSMDSLSIINSRYKKEKLLATHGNFITDGGKVCRWTKDYTYGQKTANLFRDSPWIATHPRTFRFGLFKHLDESIILDKYKKPFKAATDMAIFIPVLELSGIYSAYIQEPLYVYNKNKNILKKILFERSQRKAEKEIRGRERFSPLTEEEVEKLLTPI